MRLPLVSRRRYEGQRERLRELVADQQERIDELLFRIDRAYDDRRDAMRGAEAADRRADEAYMDCAKLVESLRVASWHVNHRTAPDDQRLTAVLDLRSEMLFHAYRYDRTFRNVLAYMLERVLLTDPDLRHSILDYPKAEKQT